MKTIKQSDYETIKDHVVWLVEQVEKEENARKLLFLRDNDFRLDGESALLFHLKALKEKILTL